MKDSGYQFCLHKEKIKLFSVFSNESFDSYKHERCHKQVIRPCFQNEGAALLKCKSKPVKVGL